MQAKFSFNILFSATVVTGAVLLASVSSATASPCPFSQLKKTTTANSGNTPTLTNSSFNTMAALSAGGAALAGVLAVGLLAKVRNTRQVSDLADVQDLSFPVHPEMLSPSEETAEREDVTLVG